MKVSTSRASANSDKATTVSSGGGSDHNVDGLVILCENNTTFGGGKLIATAEILNQGGREYPLVVSVRPNAQCQQVPWKQDILLCVGSCCAK